MEMEPDKIVTRHGLIFAAIGGIFYILLVLGSFVFLSENLPTYSFTIIMGYALFLGILGYEAYTIHAKLDFQAQIKQLFRALFITILISELAFAATTYIYIHYIDLEYVSRYYASNKEWLKSSKMPAENKTELLQGILNMKTVGFWTVMQVFLTSVIKDSIFAFLIAFIITRAFKYKDQAIANT